MCDSKVKNTPNCCLMVRSVHDSWVQFLEIKFLSQGWKKIMIFLKEIKKNRIFFI